MQGTVGSEEYLQKICHDIPADRAVQILSPALQRIKSFSSPLNGEMDSFHSIRRENNLDLFAESTTLYAESDHIKLPERELRIMDEYRLDTELLQHLMNRVEDNAAKMKQVRRYIREQIEAERKILNLSAIKIQAWYRGERCRKDLQKNGFVLKSKLLRKIRCDAVRKLQSFWRSQTSIQRLMQREQDMSNIILEQKREVAEIRDRLGGLEKSLDALVKVNSEYEVLTIYSRCKLSYNRRKLFN